MCVVCCALYLQLATVPYYEWNPLAGDDGRKMAYLRNMLGLPAVV